MLKIISFLFNPSFFQNGKLKARIKKYCIPLFYLLKILNYLRLQIFYYLDNYRIKKINLDAKIISNKLYHRYNGTVADGPFKGTKIPEKNTWHPSKIIGYYEHDLHKSIYELSHNKYEKIINVGCADGYYAIGFAKMFPNTEVLAYDTNKEIIKSAKELALINSIKNINFLELCDLDEFKKYQNSYCLIMCDIEGAENQLLFGPIDLYKNFDFIVETHDFYQAQTTERLQQHFHETHMIYVIEETANKSTKFNSEKERLLILNEHRHEKGVWLVARAQSHLMSQI